MNLRQQFFWIVLLGLSTIVILFSAYRTYNKYSEFRKYKSEYEKEAEVKDNQDIKDKTDFISSKQIDRIDLSPDYALIREKSVTNHVRAGIKTVSGSEWGSKDPLYRANVGDYCIVEYRDEEKTKYRIGDKIDGTNMIIESCNQDSMIVNVQSDKKFTSNKDPKFRIFYMSSEKK